jgi:two-component system chemotaxis response regulator CheY
MSDKRTILVVDDIPLMRTILGKYVKGIGLKVLTEELGVSGLDILEAPNGAAALQLLKEQPIDLVFLDLMMPEMDGLAFLRQKGADPGIRGIPVIVCSALGEKDTVEKARELGAAGYIVKPFTLKAVEERFREAMTTITRS